jgi:predicted ATPase/class 3 adenylate cyclase
VPTGWQIVSDLISKVAALEGATVGGDPIGWYRGRFGGEPDYSRLLDELAKSPTERSVLLRKYFEPTDDERRRGIRVPGAAHRALGQLAAKGYISVFLTTNFDRLLEQALEAAGVVPTTLSTPDSLEGSVPLGHARCTVVKLNGDYLDTRIKNTPVELDSYHPSIDTLLDRVLDEYGLIVCGWSAEWDTALRRAFERCRSHRYTTFWASRNPPGEKAARLIELRQAETVRIKDPDALFTDLVAKLPALDEETGVEDLARGEDVLPTVNRNLASSSRDNSSAETLTFLFTDLEGSTHLWEKFPDAMKDALKRHDAILQAAIEASGGRIVKSTGDGTMAVFGSAVDAATASLVAQRGLAKEPWSETGPLRVRMGLHSGQAEQRADDFFGPTVNRTARIMAAGHGGQVLFSASAASLASERLPTGASLLDLGEHRLRDLGRAEHVFQLVHPDLVSTFPPLATLNPAGANLPARAAPFVGRQTELKEITNRLEDTSVRLLTLVGPGGTGKTTLAIRAAEGVSSGFSDGVSFVDLSKARNTNAVLIAIARAIGLGEVINRPLQEELTARLRDRRMLLVLDNFEQVTEAAGFVAQLLGDCPRLVALVTSREALHLRAEHVYPVPPLALPPAGPKQASARQIERYEAAQLFIDRAQAVRPDFQLTDDNAPVVAEICRRLDGLPLAIELAAARLRLFSPEALQAQLRDRLKLLRSGARDLPERQQTLRATVDWSYELLKPEEQRLFELLAVFADADIASVEALAARVAAGDGVTPDVLDGLTSLIEKSLIRQVELPRAEPRVAMLETIREFAADRLDQRPDFSSRARQAHATYYADFARRLQADLTGDRRTSVLAAMAAEVGNLRIAWGYWVSAGDLQQLEKLADSLLILNDAHGWYLDTVGLTTDMLSVLSKNASSPDRISQEIALRTSLARALMATKGFTPEVEDAFASSVELFERGTDARQQFSVLRGLASLYNFRGEVDKAAQIGREILAFAERENNPRMLIEGHLLLGTPLMFVNDLQGGLDHLDRAISLFAAVPVHAFSSRGGGNDPRVACFTTSAFTLWLLGYPDRALERVNDALTLAVKLDHPFTSAFARFHSGLLHFWRREFDTALDRAVGLLEIADEHNFQIWKAAGTCLSGAAQAGLGRFGEGLANLRSGMDLYQGLRSPPVFWPMLLSLEAAANHHAGRPAEGLRPIDAAIEIMSPGPGTTLLPELQILKGDLLVALAADDGRDGSGAEHWYRLAFDRARDLNARMSQLRAAARLSRVWQAKGEHEAAARTLGSVYATFTEGFATADLLEARDLLAAITPGGVPQVVGRDARQ